MDTKTCSTCKSNKLNTEEHFYKSDKGRLRSECKTCTKAKSKARHHANRDQVLAKQKARYSTEHNRLLTKNKEHRIRNHTDPDVVPFQEWHDMLVTFKERSGFSWEEMERAAKLSDWTIRNWVRGRTWPPIPEEAEEIMEALERYLKDFNDSDDARVDLDAWLKFCDDHKKKTGLSYYAMEKIMGVKPSYISTQRRGRGAAPTKGEARRYLRRLHGLATELTEEERKNIKYKTVRLPDGSFQTDVIINRPSVP